MNRLISTLLATAALAVAFVAPVAGAEQYEVWPGLKADLFGDKPIAEEDGMVSLETPYRADDAAMVPLSVRIPAQIAPKVSKLFLVIDQNPAPVAATFTFGKGMGDGERMMETRVRVDMYSNVRAIIEEHDGTVHMTTKFVKASGGCSAPAGKDVEEAMANLGKMQIKTFAPSADRSVTQAQVMMRHVQYTGMQMDQATRHFTPAHFVTELTVMNGDELAFRVDGGISISENPNYRFSYGGSGIIEVTAKDTDGRVFTARHDPKGS